MFYKTAKKVSILVAFRLEEYAGMDMYAWDAASLIGFFLLANLTFRSKTAAV